MNIVQPAAPPLSPDLIATVRSIVGDKYAVTDAADIAPYLTEERDLFHGRSPLVLRPGTTAEVAAICKLATEHRIALVIRAASNFRRALAGRCLVHVPLASAVPLVPIVLPSAIWSTQRGYRY